MKQKCDKPKEGQNAQLFMRLSALSGIESNYELYRLQSYWWFYILIKSHSKICFKLMNSNWITSLKSLFEFHVHQYVVDNIKVLLIS